MTMARLLHGPCPAVPCTTTGSALVTEIGFCAWVAQAEPGAALVYHRGFLVVDTDRLLSSLAPGARHARPPHDLGGAPTIRGRKHDARPPGELARCVAAGQQSLKLSAISWAEVKADVGASHPPTMPQPSMIGNLASGVEH